MPTNLFAVLRESGTTQVRHIVLDRSIQDELRAEFRRQAESFLAFTHRVPGQDGKPQLVTVESERISFFPIYSLHDSSQILEIPNFPLDAPIASAVAATDSVPLLTLDKETLPKIRALCAAETGRSSTRLFLPSHSTGGERFPRAARPLLQSGETFSRLTQPGFTLGSSVDAIYDNGVLLFRSFAVASRFLSLVHVFNEASDEKIKEDVSRRSPYRRSSEVLQTADTTMRKQFAAVSELRVLDKAKPNSVKAIAADFGIKLDVGKHEGRLRIEFPSTKKEQKELLTFLTEGYYVGPITGNKYQSNSHRPLKTKG